MIFMLLDHFGGLRSGRLSCKRWHTKARASPGTFNVTSEEEQDRHGFFVCAASTASFVWVFPVASVGLGSERACRSVRGRRDEAKHKTR